MRWMCCTVVMTNHPRLMHAHAGYSQTGYLAFNNRKIKAPVLVNVFGCIRELKDAYPSHIANSMCACCSLLLCLCPPAHPY